MVFCDGEVVKHARGGGRDFNVVYQLAIFVEKRVVDARFLSAVAECTKMPRALVNFWMR